MPASSAFLENWRVKHGHPMSKLYLSYPITLKPAHLNDIAEAVAQGASDHRIRLFVNSREILLQTYGQTLNVVDAIQMNRTYEEVRAVSIQSDQVMFFFARGASGYSVTAEIADQGVLWKVSKILESARWRFGSFLFRTWGAAVAITLTFLVALIGFDVQPVATRSVAVTSMLIALGLYIGGTLVIARFRRVRFDLRLMGERKGANLDILLKGLIVPILGLVINSIWPLIVAWWAGLLASLTY